MKLKLGVFLVEARGSEALFYFCGTRFAIRGEFAESLLTNLCQLLESAKSFNELKTRLPNFSAPDIEAALSALSRAGFLDISDDLSQQCEKAEAASPLFAILQKFSPSQRVAAELMGKLREESVGILSLGLEAVELEAALVLMGVKNFKTMNLPSISMGEGNLAFKFLMDAGSELMAADKLVVLANWYDFGRLKDLNKIFLARKRTWMPIIRDFFGGTIGPILGIDDGPCFECLLARKTANSSSPEATAKLESFFCDRPQVLPETLPLFRAQLANAAAFEVFKQIIQPMQARTMRGIIEFDFLNHRSEFHSVLPLPVCVACGPFMNSPQELSDTRNS